LIVSPIKKSRGDDGCWEIQSEKISYEYFFY